MEFWGVEVKGGQALKVVPKDGMVIHISQAALGEVKKKGSDFIPLKLKINGSTLVVGTLSAEKIPQLTFDLVLEKEFELSHDWKNGSIYVCGYAAENPEEDDGSDVDMFASEEDEDEPQHITQNGNIKPEVVKAKSDAKGKAGKPETSAKPSVKVTVPEEEDDSESDDIDDSDEDDSEMDSEDSEELDDSAEDSEDETPKKVEPIKKRPSESAAKTPVSAKKAKLETPQKTDGKKGSGHVATPHPSKQGGKTPASGNKSKAKEQSSPKSAGKLTCGSCSKTFNSDGALQSHSKAKHAAK